jgi:CHASE3 domain sensor protein
LENDEIVRQFDEIEQKVGRLIEASKSLEATNQELQKKVDSLEQELQGKITVESNYIEERDLIRSKIDNLLVRLAEMTEAS